LIIKEKMIKFIYIQTEDEDIKGITVNEKLIKANEHVKQEVTNSYR